MVKIPDVDKPKIGPRNVLAVVLEVNEAGFYRLDFEILILAFDFNRIGTKDGQLPNWYSRNQLGPTSEAFIFASDVPNSQLQSLRSAVASSSITGGQGVTKCNCKGQCDNNRCSCKKAGLQCNSRCHKSSLCSNK